MAPKGHLSVDLSKIFISKKALAPSGGCSRRSRASPCRTVLHNWLSKQRSGLVPFLSQPCPTEGNCSKPGPWDLDVESRWCVSAGLSRGCWEMAGAPVVDSKNCKVARDLPSCIQLPVYQTGKLRPREMKESAKAAQWVLSSLLPQMGTDTAWGLGHLHGLRGSSAKRTAEQAREYGCLYGRGWKEPAGGLCCQVEREPGLWNREQHRGRLAVPQSPIQHGEGLRGEGPRACPQGCFPQPALLFGQMSQSLACHHPHSSLGPSLPSCFKCNVPGEQNTPDSSRILVMPTMP